MSSFFSHFRSVCMLLVFVAAATSASSQGETTQDSLLTHFSLAVYDYDTGAPLDSAKIQIHSFTNSFDVCTNQEGEVAFDLCCDSLVSLDISYENYIGLGDIVKIEDTNRQIRREYFMKEIRPSCYSYPELYFKCHTADTCSWNGISSLSELNLWAHMLENNPDLSMELSASLSLSENEMEPTLGVKRMNFCRDFLIQQGIDKRRILLGEIRVSPNPSTYDLIQQEDWCCEPVNRRVSFHLLRDDFEKD